MSEIKKQGQESEREQEHVQENIAGLDEKSVFQGDQQAGAKGAGSRKSEFKRQKKYDNRQQCSGQSRQEPKGEVFVIWKRLADFGKAEFRPEIEQFAESGDDELSAGRVDVEVILMGIVSRDEFSKVDLIKHGFIGMPKKCEVDGDTGQNEDN